MAEQHIATVQKNHQEEIRVGLSDFNGYDLAFVRVWIQIQESGEWVPTKKGITFNSALLPDLIDALTKTLASKQAQEG
jgi:hypothetical protein